MLNALEGISFPLSLGIGALQTLHSSSTDASHPQPALAQPLMTIALKAIVTEATEASYVRSVRVVS